MDLALVLLVAVVVLLAELPDKSMFAALVLGTRFRPVWVFVGVAGAFLVHVLIAVTAGSLLRLLPQVVVGSAVTALFALGAAYLWWHRDDEDEEEADAEAESESEVDTAGGAGSPAAGPAVPAPAAVSTRRAAWTALGTSFGVVFLGEWGDITQVLTANLAARYHDTLAVGVGAVLGLWCAAGLAITLGRTLMRRLSVPLLHRIGAAVLLVFAVISLVELLRR